MADDLVADARALPAGKAPERIEVRAGETRVVLIDCAPLLREGELIEAATGAATTPSGVTVGAVRTRQARYVEAQLRAPAGADIKTWRDYLLTARLRTTRGQSLQACVTLRVHRE